MEKRFFDVKTVVIYLLIFSLFLSITLIGNRAVTAFSEMQDHLPTTVIIDAGHGGVDGGAVSCTGVYESHINLQISKILDDLMHLLGIPTVMVRDTDKSVYTKGETIAAKKVSDIRNRVSLVNQTSYALLISIHQNNFTDARYYGAQVFYNGIGESSHLADNLQQAFRQYINPENKRQTKKVNGVYLMDHINTAGVLIECGFLSNPEEESLLRDHIYQQKLCSVIATVVSQYLNT